MSILFSILCLCACLSVSLQLRLGLHVLALDSRVSGNKTKQKKHFTLENYTLHSRYFFLSQLNTFILLKNVNCVSNG